ncbi:ABC transporter substrate-binding protein, partial [Anoxybacillus sp. LAT_38]|nr:ABC transporter substrate-binding protein [Anoxybacillus sp. LAT_38]
MPLLLAAVSIAGCNSQGSSAGQTGQAGQAGEAARAGSGSSANAKILVSNPDVLGVVGHFNTGVAIPASVKYETGSLVMVSPANSGVQLTEEGKKTVHRICARDDAQGPKGAKYAKETLGVKSVFLLHDKTAYGQGLVDQVKAQFEKDGVQV